MSLFWILILLALFGITMIYDIEAYQEEDASEKDISNSVIVNNNNLRMTITTEKSIYKSYENIPITVTLENIGDEPIYYSSTPMDCFGLHLNVQSLEGFTSNKMHSKKFCNFLTKQDPLLPNEPKQFETEWIQPKYLSQKMNYPHTGYHAVYAFQSGLGSACLPIGIESEIPLYKKFNPQILENEIKVGNTDQAVAYDILGADLVSIDAFYMDEKHDLWYYLIELDDVKNDGHLVISWSENLPFSSSSRILIDGISLEEYVFLDHNPCGPKTVTIPFLKDTRYVGIISLGDILPLLKQNDKPLLGTNQPPECWWDGSCMLFDNVSIPTLNILDSSDGSSCIVPACKAKQIFSNDPDMISSKFPGSSALNPYFSHIDSSFTMYEFGNKPSLFFKTMYVSDPEFQKWFDEKFSPLQFDSMQNKSEITLIHVDLVPNWLQHNVKWWIDKEISDTDFFNSLSYLVRNDVIYISPQTLLENSKPNHPKLENHKYHVERYSNEEDYREWFDASFGWVEVKESQMDDGFIIKNKKMPSMEAVSEWAIQDGNEKKAYDNFVKLTAKGFIEHDYDFHEFQ